MTVKKLPHKNHFYFQLIKSLVIGFLFLIISLGIGVVGYHYFFDIPWLDSLVNAYVDLDLG